MIKRSRPLAINRFIAPFNLFSIVKTCFGFIYELYSSYLKTFSFMKTLEYFLDFSYFCFLKSYRVTITGGKEFKPLMVSQISPFKIENVPSKTGASQFCSISSVELTKAKFWMITSRIFVKEITAKIKIICLSLSIMVN
jgi:hypothetical protein